MSRKSIGLLFFTYALAFSALAFPTIAFAAWSGSPYAPGETLNPECAPTDDGCTIDATLSVWSSDGSNVYRASGYVGIGTSTPLYMLDVNGDINFTGDLYKNGELFGNAVTLLGNNVATAGLTALEGLRGGEYNLALGYAALYSNTNGSDNIGLGLYALHDNLTGSNNVAIGSSALSQANDDLNVAVGYGAGSNLLSGNNNIAIGSYTDFASANASNQLNIGNSIYGDLLSHYVGIGTTSPGSLLALGNTNGINFTLGTTTFSTEGGINIASGCFSIAGVCVTGTGEGGGGEGESVWSTNGSDIYYSGGNIGIGTDSPTYQLQLSGTTDEGFGISISNDSNIGQTTLITSNDLGSQAIFGINGSEFSHVAYANRAYVEGSTGVSLISESGDIRFYSGGADDASEALRIDSSGLSLLSNQLVTAGNSLRFATDGEEDTNDGTIASGLFDQGLNLVGTVTDGTYRKLSLWGEITQQSNPGTNTWAGTNYFAGNVGINTNSPSYNLDVAGDINFTGDLLKNGVHFGGDITTVGTNVGTTLWGSLGSIDDAWYNVVLGYQALQSVTDGSDNVALGLQALQFNTVGNSNIGIGGNALQQSTGDSNVGIGVGAGSNLESGNANIAIGAGAAFIDANGSYQLSIGNTIYGNLQDKSIVFGDNNTASGAYSFAAGAANQATGTAAVAFGYNSSAGGYGSFVTGFLNHAYGEHSFAAGYDNITNGSYSFAAGGSNLISGVTSIAFGQGNTISGDLSAALGHAFEITGSGSFGIGNGGGFDSITNDNTLAVLGVSVGIGTTTPMSALVVQDGDGWINFSGATSTFSTTGGINLTGGGCFAINGVCIIGGDAGSNPWTVNDLNDIQFRGYVATGDIYANGTIGIRPQGYNPTFNGPAIMSGFWVEWWNDQVDVTNPDYTLTPVVSERTDPNVDFYVVRSGFINGEYINARISGWVKADYTETYTFCVNSDDGARLTIGSNVIVGDSWSHHGVESHCGDIDLEAGTWYPIIVEYYQEDGSAALELNWSSPSVGDPQSIPLDHTTTMGRYVGLDEDISNYDGLWVAGTPTLGNFLAFYNADDSLATSISSSLAYFTQNIGIGTTTSVGQVTIAGSGAERDGLTIIATSSEGYSETGYINDLGHGLYVGLGGSEGYGEYADRAYLAAWQTTGLSFFVDTGDFRFYAGGDESSDIALTIDNDGNVGIGTSTPAYKLDVNGDINFTGDLYHNGTLVSLDSGSSGLAGSGLVGTTASLGINAFSVAFNDDGSRMYVGDNNGATYYEFTLSTPWDVTTAETSGAHDFGGDVGQVEDIAFSSDGTTMYMAAANMNLYVYSLLSPWQIGIANLSNTIDLSDHLEDSFYSISFSSDGSKLYIIEVDTGVVLEYSLGTPWDASTLTYEGQYTTGLAGDMRHFTPGMRISADGMSFTVSRYDDAASENPVTLHQYILDTPWDITSASSDPVATYHPRVNAAGLFAFGDDDSYFYLPGTDESDNPVIFQYQVGSGSFGWAQNSSGDLFFLVGNVGIGTDTPDTALTLEGDLSDTFGIHITNANSSGYAETYFSNDVGSDGYVGIGGSENSFAYADRVYLENGNALGISFLGGNGDIRFFTDGVGEDDQRMIIDNLGNVGIGTTTPEAVLDVFGTVRIAGVEDDPYLNFGTSGVGESGSGIRMHEGVMQFRNEGGEWTDFGSGSGSVSAPLTLTATGGHQGMRFVAHTVSPYGDSGGWWWSQQYKDGYLYVQREWGFEVYDVSDPAHPRYVSYYEPGSYTEVGSMNMSGNLLFLAVQDSGDERYQIQLVDISDPLHPVSVSRYGAHASGEYAYNASASGNTLYVETPYRIEIVDITDRESPTYLSDLAGGESLYYPQATSTRLTVGYYDNVTYDRGVKIFDITDPTSPVLLGTYTSPTKDFDEYTTAGNYLYLINGNDQAEAVDISDPTSPVLLGTYTSASGDLNYATVASSTLYSANYQGYIEAIDFSDPAHPVLSNTYRAEGGFSAPLAIDNYLFAINRRGNVQVIDTSDLGAPSIAALFLDGRVGIGTADPIAAFSVVGDGGRTPTLLSTYTSTSTGAYGEAVVSGGYAYAATYAGTIEILNVSDSTHPVWVSNYTSENGDLYYLQVVGNTLFAKADGSANIIEAIDITDPVHPSLLYTLTGDSGANLNLYEATEDTVYAIDENNVLEIFDVSDPENIAAPTLVSTYNFSNNNSPVVIGSLAYVGDESGVIHIYDVSDPTTPVEVNTYDGDSDALWGFFIDNSVLYAENDYGEIEIADVGSDPTNPAYMSTYYDASGSMNLYGHSLVSNGILFLTNDDDEAGCSITMVDVSDTGSPRFIQRFHGVTDCEYNPFVVENRVYTINDNDDLAIFDISSVLHPSAVATFMQGNVGIGTDNPLSLLDVHGDIMLSGGFNYLNFGDAAGEDGYGIRDYNGYLQYKNRDGDWTDFGSGEPGWFSPYSGVVVHLGGTVAIDAGGVLYTNGDVIFQGLSPSGDGAVGIATVCITSSGELVTSEGGECVSSTERIKHDIEGLTLSGTSTLMQITPSSFVYNNDASSTVQWGFIAEDLASTSANFIGAFDIEGKPLTIKPIALLAVVVKAIQEITTMLQGFAEHFVSKQVDTQKLCIGDTCVTEDQLKALMQSQSIPVVPSGGSSIPSPEESAPAPDEVVSDDSAPEEEIVETPADESVPESPTVDVDTPDVPTVDVIPADAPAPESATPDVSAPDVPAPDPGPVEGGGESL